MIWEDQGRQEHGWFGHGTAGNDRAGRFGPDGLDQRLRAMGHTAIAAIPRKLRYHHAASYEGVALDQLVTTMRAWVRGLLLDRAEFASRYFGRGVNDPVVDHLWQAAKFAAIARNEAELRSGTEHLAAAMQAEGLDRWRRFMNDAQQRAAEAARLPVPPLNGAPEPKRTASGVAKSPAKVAASSKGGSGADAAAQQQPVTDQQPTQLQQPTGNAKASTATQQATADQSPAPADRSGVQGAAGSAPARPAIATAADQQQRLELARKLGRAGGHATAEDAEAVAKHLASSMSLSQLQKMQSQGIRVVAARDSVADYLTGMGKDRPRGWPPGQTLKDVPAIYNPSTKEVVIGTHAGSNGGREMPGPDQTSSVDAVVHEVGHAINYNQYGSSGILSDRDDFKNAYDADAGKGHLADRYYHQQDAAAGRDEAFAESHAMYIHDSKKMGKEYPHLYAYWQHYYGAKR